MTFTQDIESANEKYASSFNKGNLQVPPKRKAIILTCMDSRVDPGRALGLELGDAHVIRNLGGRVADALRSIIVSQQLLGTREIIILHHTDCGMQHFTDEIIREKIRTELHQNADHLAFLPSKDVEKSLLDDVRALRESPLVLDVPITGYVYQVQTGRIVKVET